MSEVIKSVDVVAQSKEDMTKYAIYVTRSRSIPGYQDGLKPVQRKIIWDMWNDTSANREKTVKSARIVGDVVGKYHPHGDAAVYGAMKTLTNWFECYMPLIVPHGNFGDFLGNGAAHMRYTEAKLSDFSKDCLLSELKFTDKVVDWDDTYDYDGKEPSYLPASVPILLINGCSGIGVGIKTEIPCHNVNEVIDATIKLIHNPNAQITLIPDTCMPCEIIDNNFKAISNKGSGTYVVRGIVEIGEYKGNPALYIRSTPDQVYLNTVKDKIEDLVNSNKLVQIHDINEFHDTDKPIDQQMCLIIQLKKGSDPEYVRQVLYKQTSLQKTCSVNFEVLDDLTPMRMSYKSYLEAFILFRKLTKFRLYCNRLQDKQTRFHQVDALVKVIESGELDTIINMIRHHKTNDDSVLIDFLVKKIKLTDLQAKYIIRTRLGSLSEGHLKDFKEEAHKLIADIENFKYIITHDDVILKEIEEELLMYKSKYGSKRRSKVISVSEASNIPSGEFRLIITENNFIKKIQLNETIGTLKNDTPKSVINVENTQNILIFDELGKMYKLPVHKIPFSDKHSPGLDIRTVIKGLTSNINSVLYEPTVLRLSKTINTKYFAVILTKSGMIKRLDLQDILSATPSGIVYVKLEDGDSVQDIVIVGTHSDVVVYNKNNALRIACEDIPYLKRATKGAKSMTSGPVEGLSIIKKDTTDIIVITEKGKVNRFTPAGLPCNGRNKKSSKVIKLSKGDSIKTIYGVDISDSIKVISEHDTIDLPVESIPIGSSVSTGAKIFSTRSDKIIKVSVNPRKA